MKIAAKGSSEQFLRSNVNYAGSDCLEWPYRRVPAGYGLAVIGGVQKRASRWMCILAHGEPSNEKLHSAHSCGNPGCVNPTHLRWDTPKGNAADRLLHGTENRGENSGRTRLTTDDVLAIRSAPADLKLLCSKYGVSKGCISKIRSRQRWHYA